MPLLVCGPTGRLWLARQKDVKSFHTVLANGPKKSLTVAAAKCSERRGNDVFVPGMMKAATPNDQAEALWKFRLALILTRTPGVSAQINMTHSVQRSAE